MLKWLEIKEYAKNHKFHTIILALLIFASVAEVFQFALIAKNYSLTQNNEQAIERVNIELQQKEAALTDKINNTDISVNSRIDILDSSVKVQEKRKMLVKKVRDAISENTTTKLDIRTLNRIAIAVIDYGYTYNLSISGLLAQLSAESDFNPDAVSKAGAQGIGQIMPGTLDYLRMRSKNPMLNPWDVSDGVFMTCFYMAELKTKFGSWEEALRAYNAGPDNVRKVNAGLQEYLQETKDYVPKIQALNEKFKKYGLE